MCHRRGEWSRTSSRASESETEREREEPSGWRVRARDRLASLLGAGHDADETPERPAVDADPETPSVDPSESEAPETPDDSEPEEDEREDPIPADD